MHPNSCGMVNVQKKTIQIKARDQTTKKACRRATCKIR